MRWLLLLIALTGLFGTVASDTAGMFTLSLVAFILGSLAAAFAFAQARIEGNARPESISQVDMEALKRSLAKGNATPPSDPNND